MKYKNCRVGLIIERIGSGRKAEIVAMEDYPILLISVRFFDKPDEILRRQAPSEFTESRSQKKADPLTLDNAA